MSVRERLEASGCSQRTLSVFLVWGMRPRTSRPTLNSAFHLNPHATPRSALPLEVPPRRLGFSGNANRGAGERRLRVLVSYLLAEPALDVILGLPLGNES